MKTILHSNYQYKLLLLFLAFLNLPGAICQSTFEKTYFETGFYDRGNYIVQTGEGGYLVAGRTSAFTKGGVQGYVLRIDTAGNTLWNKNYGGSGSEEFMSACPTADGGYVMTGYTDSYGNGKQDVYLLKINEKGDSLWEKTFGGKGIDRGNDVVETPGGDFVITGETYSFGDGSVNAYLVKSDSKGTKKWAEVFGGNGIEAGNAIDITSDGGYVITGKTNSFGAGDYDIYLIRTDKDGKQIFMKAYGGSGAEEGTSIKQTKDGGFVITGFTKSFGSGGSDIYVVKTNAQGNEEWAGTFGGKNDEYGKSVWQTLDGGYIIAGYSNSFGNGVEAYLIRLNADGEELWTRLHGSEKSDTYISTMQQTIDGGFVVTGTMITAGKDGGLTEKMKHVYLLKTDISGKLLQD